MKKIFVLLIILLSFSCIYNDWNLNYPEISTGITGLVIDEYNQPVSNAFVYIYRNPSSGLIGPADFMEKTDEKGNFFFDIPEGKYYLVVRKRLSGLDSGPLKQGDRVSNYQKNPIILKLGEIKNFKITLPSKTHILQKKTPSGETTIKIKLQGEELVNGRLFLLVYEGEKEKKIPDYLQEITEKDVTINLPPNRVFYIVVRENLKDKIEKNEIYGKFGPFTSDIPKGNNNNIGKV